MRKRNDRPYGLGLLQRSPWLPSMSKRVVAGMKTYRGHFGAARYDSHNVRSYSLDLDNARYIDSIPKGEKSAAVNRMIHAYRTKGKSLQDRIDDLEAQLAFYIEKTEPQMGDKTRKRGFLSWLFRR